MNKNFVIFTIVLIGLISASGCVNSTESNEKEPNNGLFAERPMNDHFKKHFQEANLFWKAKEEGDESRKNHDFQRALVLYNKALSEYAYSKPEQTIASERIAMTYEEMGNLNEAAKYYDLASEVTMNEDRKISLSQKAQELRGREK